MGWHRTAAKPLHHLHRQQEHGTHQNLGILVTFHSSLASQKSNLGLAYEGGVSCFIFKIKNYIKTLQNPKRIMKSQEKN